LHYIEFQYKSLKKYFKGEYEYIVINDAKTYGDHTNFGISNMMEQIENKCKELGVTCINVPQEIHNNRRILFPNTTEPDSEHPCCRCATAVQYGFSKFNNLTDGFLMLLDSDMFLYDYIDIRIIMEDYDILGIPQRVSNGTTIVEYLWNAICIFNLNKCKNLNEFFWDCGQANGVAGDVGVECWYYIQKYNPKIKKTAGYHYDTPESFLNTEKDQNIIKFCSIICDISGINNCNKDIFKLLNIFHLRGGGNWDHRGEYYHNKQYELVNTIFFQNN